jgi:mono/diheme cytochrome c family protein
MFNKILMSTLVLGVSLTMAAEKATTTTTTTTTTTVKKAEETAPAKTTTTTTTTTTTGKKFDLADGKKTFEANCLMCHGATGKGDGAAAAALKPKPRDFTDKKDMSKRSWEELHKVISEGGANSGFSALMPAWKGTLKKPQIDNVLAARVVDKPKAKAKAE